jgi:mannose/fructose/N-acetylgalactosamine-specific phosphotransferase system component IIC
MAHNSGRGLMMAGGIVTFVGLCIVLIRVLRVPEYWMPLMVGFGLFLLGLIRWLTTRDS